MKKRIAIVQPILSPYSIPRFEELAKDETLEIILLIEKSTFSHRPGWNVTDVKGCTVEIIGSHIRKERIENTEQGYVIEGIRAIPYRLPMLLLKYRPHIILVCNATELLFAYLLKHILNYKIGLIVEDTIHAVSNLKPLNRSLKSVLYKKADFYLPFSNDALKYLNNIKINKPFYRTSWSVDLNHFSKFDNEAIKDIRDSLRLNDKLVFLAVSRLDAGKGILNLLRAIKGLPNDFLNNISLLIVGSGPQENELREFIRVNDLINVSLLGQKNYDELVTYYHLADIFILPTLKDLFSLTVMEAMACGLPILTTKYNGARELIEEGKNG